MILLSPLAFPILWWSVRDMSFSGVPAVGWGALAYLCGVSMFLASIFWYRGLAAGGAARIGQINLLLPLAGIFWAALFLGETVTPTVLLVAAIVFGAMAVCLRTRRGK